ncbi:MAG: hypothetical protein Q8P32_02395 [Candidatus Komeilibacteria bacterium]|nr:hypothetical protein [Candidatus Komeilibacteria bacterium]
MEDRARVLLSQIIREYLKTASPVGSRCLEAKSRLGVSSATIRNEMAVLEKEGYITQPYTSAGRVPTQKGYEFFLERCQPGKVSDKEAKEISELLKQKSSDQLEFNIKQLAKKLAQFSQGAVVIGFSEDDFYYTGLSNLFSQPEFQDPELVYDLGLIIDRLDQAMNKVFENIAEIQVLIGSQNPFGRQCSVVLSSWKISDQTGIMGILGPMRMDYEKNLGLLNFIRANI